MFVPDTLNRNAFRVLRVSADATLSEIHKAAGAMRRAVALGIVSTTEVDVPLLGEIPRTEAAIRAALGRLENPTQRLKDRLFWFCAAPESRTGGAPHRANEPDRTLWSHNEALRGLVAALGAGWDNAGLSLWTQAIRAWHKVVSDDAYWGNALEIEQQGDFEPTAFPSEIDGLRDEAVQLAAEPLVVSGRDALARDDSSTVRRILGAITGLSDTGRWAVIATHDIAAPAIESFRRKCRAVHEELGSQIIRDEHAGERNKSTCGAEINRFRSEIEPGLNQLIQILPPNHPAVQESREKAALCLSANRGYDTRGFVAATRELNVTPHVAQNNSNRRSAIDGRTTRHEGYEVSQRKRKRVEEVFGWMKTVALQRKTRFRGADWVGWMFTLSAAAYNLVRMRNLQTATA